MNRSSAGYDPNGPDNDVHQEVLFGACVLALAGAGLTTGSASAQPASGFYLSQEIGLNVAPPVALLGNSTDRASRCDEFINPRFAEVPAASARI